MAVPALEVGGTHVAAALVDPSGWSVVPGTERSEPVDAQAGAEAILDRFAAAAAGIPAGPSAVWGVAMPDPFDYERGVALFEGVGKFDALRGTDLAARLAQRVGGRFLFLNDADAFCLGEWVAGAGRGARRCTGLTLGTGVGTGWVAGGRVVDPGQPPGGRAHRLLVDGRPLEDVMSRRALRRAYAERTGDSAADVREIAGRARAGEPDAREVLAAALRALGRALAPGLAAFAPDVIVVGGSMARSWDLFAPWFEDGLGRPLAVRRAALPNAGLVGAAYHAATGRAAGAARRQSTSAE